MKLARFLALLTLCGTVVLPAFAQQDAPQIAQVNGEEDEEKELSNLLNILKEETTIATKTMMNSDYVPGIVNVYQGEELEALGALTVWDALSLVPGVQQVLDASTQPSVIVRGTEFPFNSGNIKILIDGVPVTQERAGITPAILYFPVHHVERIEFIRGPGSVVYGDFAFMGLLNIITRKESSRAYLRGGSDDSIAGGARYAHGTATTRMQFSAAASAVHSDDALFPVGRSGHDDQRWGLFSARSGGLSVSADYVDRDLQETTNLPPTAPRLHPTETSWSLQTAYGRELARNLHADFHVGHLQNELTGPISDFDGGVSRAGVDLQWQPVQQHSVLAASEYQWGTIDSAGHHPSGPPGLPPPPQTNLRNVDRHVLSFTLQDRFDISRRFSLTGGVRYDDHSDVGERWTPRIAGVWRISDRHVLKAQYAEGFRPPTFFELYAGGTRNPSLTFETNATSELNYIYRRADMVVRATLFRAKIGDMIFATPRFTNDRTAQSQGVELEWSQQITPRLKVLANASKFSTEDERDRVGGNSATTPDFLATGGILLKPLERLVAGVQWQHVGARNSGAVDAYDVVNVSLTRHDIFVPELDVRAGVRNALNDEVAFLLTRPNQVDAVQYQERTFWLELSWRH